MKVLCLLGVIAVSFIGVGHCGYINANQVDAVISGYANAFQNVVVANKNNFTQTLQVLQSSNVTDQQVLQEFTQLMKQFSYTYTNFQIATNVLINSTYEALNSNGQSSEAVYTDNTYLIQNIDYLNDTSSTLSLVLDDLQTLITESVTLQGKFVVQGSTATIPFNLAREISNGLSELAKLNNLIQIFLGNLSTQIRHYVYSNPWNTARLQKIVVPLTEYSNIMRILSQLCKRLTSYFNRIAPMKVVTGLNSTDVEINKSAEFNQGTKIVYLLKRIYTLTEKANDNVISVLKAYKPPVTGSPTTPPLFWDFPDSDGLSASSSSS